MHTENTRGTTDFVNDVKSGVNDKGDATQFHRRHE